MYDSGVSPSALIEQVKSETDIRPELPLPSYVRILSSLEQQLYSDYIREERAATVTPINNVISLQNISVG